jgi:protein-S-isoprenylcysteine O-methyltransferase Ste14
VLQPSAAGKFLMVHLVLRAAPAEHYVRRPQELIVLLLLKNLLFTVFVPGTVAVYIPLRIVTNRFGSHATDWGPWQVTALLPLSIGAAIYFWCLRDFAMRGRGTPAPIDAPKQLVVRGLYQYVRNPMYIGVLLVIVGWGMFFQSWRILTYAGAVGICFHLFVVLIEEPVLREKFREEYISYCGEVRRWVPRVGRKQAV